MFLKIIGWIWVCCGVIFLIWPQLLKKHLVRKGIKKMRRLIFFLFLPILLWLFLIVFEIEPIILKLGLLIFIVLTVKSIFYLISRTAYRAKSFLSQRPQKLFRFLAFFYLILAVSFLVFAA